GYLFCKDQNYTPANKNNETSYNFDKTIRENIDANEAVNRGYYNRSNMYALLDADPFFNGGRGDGLRSSMKSDLDNLSTVIGTIVIDDNKVVQPGKNIFQFVDWMLYCKLTVDTDDPYLFLNSWNSCTIDNACRSTAYEWEMYRNYYLQLKSKYVHQL